MSDDKSVVEALEEMKADVSLNTQVVTLLEQMVEVQRECLEQLKKIKKDKP